MHRAPQHHILVVSYLSKQQNQQEQQLLSDITSKQSAAKVTAINEQIDSSDRKNM